MRCGAVHTQSPARRTYLQVFCMFVHNQIGWQTAMVAAEPAATQHQWYGASSSQQRQDDCTGTATVLYDRYSFIQDVVSWLATINYAFIRLSLSHR